MSLHRTILSTAVFFFVACALASAQDVERSRVRTRLVADTAAVEPGSTFRLGVHFEIEDGWHIYWRNPSGAGLATAIEFDLPAGCVAGPLQWPLPITFAQSEGIPGYGYEGSVVLATEVTVSTDIDRSQPGTVRAEVSSLACKGICVLGSAEFEASLLKLIPYNRAGETMDIARVAVWLASDEADYITGTTLYVDGGMLLYPGFATGG